MLKTFLIPYVAIASLGGCAELPADFNAAIADTYQDTPFDTGEISVLAEEQGDLRSFTLRPCGEGHVCGARQGELVKARDYYVVSGAYAGRTFYISPGGDGWIKQSGVLYPMAWN